MIDAIYIFSKCSEPCVTKIWSFRWFWMRRPWVLLDEIRKFLDRKKKNFSKSIVEIWDAASWQLFYQIVLKQYYNIDMIKKYLSNGSTLKWIVSYIMLQLMSSAIINDKIFLHWIYVNHKIMFSIGIYKTFTYTWCSFFKKFCFVLITLISPVSSCSLVLS